MVRVGVVGVGGVESSKPFKVLVNNSKPNYRQALRTVIGILNYSNNNNNNNNNNPVLMLL